MYAKRYLKGCSDGGTGSGTRHTTMSANASSAMTTRRRKSGVAFMLETVTTALSVVNDSNTEIPDFFVTRPAPALRPPIPGSPNKLPGHSSGTFLSSSASQAANEASQGARQSPRGDSEP